MMHGTLSRHVRVIAIGSGLIAATIYSVMISVTLAHIEAVSGQIPFDMRPFGYRPADASALLDALGVQGRHYYLGYQIPLDTLYPAMLALTLITSMSLFGRRMQDSRLVRLGIILSFGASLFDYGENLGIVAMIGTWPAPPAHLIHAASAATVAKSILTTLAVLLAFLIVLIWSRLPKAGVRP